MKIISIINLKGGVAKTITSANISHILSKGGKRVLMIDNDKQGNLSKFYGVHSYDIPSVSDILTVRGCNTNSVICDTRYSNLDIIPANMTLLSANKETLLDTTRPQATRFRNALKLVRDNYDYCIIDNAPDINISTINALVCSDNVIIPLKIDKFAFDGLAELSQQIDEIVAYDELNPSLVEPKILITSFQRNEVNIQGVDILPQFTKYKAFQTKIRKTEKIDESTFYNKPIIEYSKRCGAAKDYISLVDEILSQW